jgi:hypothetical protein
MTPGRAPGFRGWPPQRPGSLTGYEPILESTIDVAHPAGFLPEASVSRFPVFILCVALVSVPGRAMFEEAGLHEQVADREIPCGL